MRSRYAEIAEEAIEYANAYIVKGNTSLELNELPADSETDKTIKILHIDRGLTRAREIYFSISEAYFFKEYEEFLLKFYNGINNIKKYSLGNCSELAEMAYYYIAQKSDDILVEQYYIKGGDHIFLVIGRDQASDPAKPETWGEDAYICDPWSKKHYPASEYLEKLKNYYFDRKTFRNCIEPFDPAKGHSLDRETTLDHLKKIRYARSPEYLAKMKEEYILKMNSLVTTLFNILTQLREDFDSIIKTLAEKYGEDDEKLKVIQEKSKKIQMLIIEMKNKYQDKVDLEEKIEPVTSDQLEREEKIVSEEADVVTEKHIIDKVIDPFLIAKEKLDKELKVNLQRVKDILKLSEMEKFILDKPRRRGFTLFRTKTSRDMEKAISEAEKKLSGKRKK